MIVRQGNGKMKDQTWRENKCRNVRKKKYIYIWSDDEQDYEQQSPVKSYGRVLMPQRG